MKTLLDGQSADGSGTAVAPEATGKVEVVAYGTWGGGTVAFEQTPDEGTTWIELATLTADGRMEVELYQTGQVRATVSGATSPSLDAKMFGVPANAFVVINF